jgi:hypothetical protein
MWEPRRLTTLWAFTAIYRVSFTFFCFTYTLLILRFNLYWLQTAFLWWRVHVAAGQTLLFHCLKDLFLSWNMTTSCVVSEDLFVYGEESSFYFFIMAYASALKFQSPLPDSKFVWSVTSCSCHFIFNVTKDLFNLMGQRPVLNFAEAYCNNRI